MQNNSQANNLAGQVNNSKVDNAKIYNKKSKVWPIFALLILPAILLASEIGAGLYFAIKTKTDVLPSYIERSKNPDEELSDVFRAEQLGLKAQLDVSKKIEVILDKPVKDNKLVLTFRHPTIENRDLKVDLMQLPNNPLAYVGNKPNMDVEVKHWYIGLGPINGSWRISGILESDDSEIELTP